MRMYTPFRAGLCLLALLWPGMALAQNAQADFLIARDGKAACTIVTASNPGPAVRLASLELQCHILKMTGAEVPIRTSADAVTGPRILVGASDAAKALGFEPAELAPQEYVIAFEPGALVLLGRDWEPNETNRQEQGRTTTGETLASLRHRIDYWQAVGLPARSTGEMELPGLHDEQASCYAVYDFLERCCGVRWYGPSEVNQSIPSKKELTVTGTRVRRAPALKHRSAMSGGSWPFLRGQWGDYSREQVFLHWRRLRLGGEKWAGNHTIHRQTIETTLSDPAYQAKGPAKGKNLCYSSPKLVEAVAQMARDFFDGKGELPEGFKAMGDYFAVVPEDISLFCVCDACRARLKEGRGMRTGFFSSGEVSNYWFSFINAVARELAKTHPGKYIATLAYWNYAYPPKGFDLEPNVSIAPCLHTCYYPNNAPIRENDRKLYQEWLARNRAPMFMWVYYHHPMEPALIDKWKCFPNVMVHDTARAMRGFIDDGVRGIFECGEQDQLEQYVMVKIWDDPAQDVDALIDEFFRLYFGKAAEPMKAFYLRIESIACDSANYPPEHNRPSAELSWRYLGTEERMKELGGLMAEAGTLAESEVEKKRVALWHDALWKWMENGRAAYIEGAEGSAG